MKENELKELIHEEIQTLLNEEAQREIVDITEEVRKRANRTKGTIEKVVAEITYYVDGGHGERFTFTLNGNFSDSNLWDLKSVARNAIERYFREQAEKKAGGGYESFKKLYKEIEKLQNKFSDDGYADTEGRVEIQTYLDDLIDYYKDGQVGTKPSLPTSYSEFTKRKAFYKVIENIYHRIELVLQNADEVTLQAISNYF